MGETLGSRILMAIRWVVGALLIVAGAMKAIDPNAFAIQVANYRILPHFLSMAVALYLPWLEVLCGVCIVSKTLYRGALAIAGTLMLVFIAALASAWARGLRISCGCFGSTQGLANYGTDLLLDFAILAALAFLWKRSQAEVR